MSFGTCPCRLAREFLGYLGDAVGTGDVGGDIEPGTGTGTRHEDTGDEPPKTGGGGASAGVAAHPAHWFQDDTSRSGWYYQILTGDYLWGIAVTYLGDGSLWKEFWDYQSPAFRAAHPNPNSIPVGTKMEATPDMIASAERMGIIAQAKKLHPPPGQLTGSSAWGYVAVGAAVVGVAGIGAAVLMRRRRAA